MKSADASTRASDIITLHEAAKHLQLHYATLYKLVRQGRVPGFQIGAQWRFRRGHLDKWFDEQATLNCQPKERVVIRPIIYK